MINIYSNISISKPTQVALCEAARTLHNTDSLIRTGKLLSAVVEYVIDKSHKEALQSFLEALGSNLFEPFLAKLDVDQQVSSWFLSSLGGVMGPYEVTTFAKSASLDQILTKQKKTYVTAVSDILSLVIEESSHVHDEITPTPMPSIPIPLPNPNPSSSLGYIPTVSDISAVMTADGGSTTADEQLGRILSGLASFLITDQNRFLFCTPPSRGPYVLAALLDKDVGLPVQIYYQTIFALWLLSFVNTQDSNAIVVEGVSDALEKAAVPRRLTNVLREIFAEKVIRISLATLRNMLNMSVPLRKEMVGAGLVAALQSLCFRRWNDEDIRDDLGVLADALESELASMSNFDVYRAEVLSGALEWTPVHRDEEFWRENVEKLERNQQEVLRCMVRLLQESTDNTVLAVACNDLAQFIKFHPRGRAIAQSLGVKGRLMELMVTGEGDVRRYALNCVQVLMIRWNRQQQ